MSSGVPELSMVTVTKVKGENERDFVAWSVAGQTRTVTNVRAEADDNDPHTRTLMVIPK
jgi:hypothetical protein